MRYRLRTLLITVAICFPHSISLGDVSRDVMRLLLSKPQQIVILGQVEEVGQGMSHEGGTHYSLFCKIKVIEVLKGKAPPTDTIQADIDLIAAHPIRPEKGERRVFFLGLTGGVPKYGTYDFRFGVQPASMARELKRMAEEMEAERIHKTKP